MALISTHSGLRGRPGIDLTEQVVEDAVGGLVELLRARNLPPTLAVSRDERPGGDALAETVIYAARCMGADVLDLGPASTPTAKLAARRRGLGGAIVVTGSHLGVGFNGLKLVAAPVYGPLDPRTLPKPDRGRQVHRGALQREDSAAEEHVDAVLASIDTDVVRSAGLVVGCEGGAGSAPAQLLDALGCRSAGDGDFDVGLRLDADGDRLALVDDRGRALDSECTLPLVARRRRPRTVVRSSDTSRMVDAVVRPGGGSIRVVAPGEAHLIAELTATGADLAGEGNGGVVLPGVGLARDGLAAAAAVLSLVASDGRPLSELAAELPRLARCRSTVECPGDVGGARALRAVARRLGVVQDEPYGDVRVEPGPGAWGLVRRSATEPVLKVTAEAPDPAGAEALHAELRAALVEAASET